MISNPRSRVFVIAEAGVNHNGSLELASRLVEVAADAGADAVKFQSFRTESLVTRDAPTAPYQQRNTESDVSQFHMLKQLELDEGAHQRIASLCAKRGIEFMSTPFDLESLDLLVRVIGVARLKIPSGEIANAPLLLAAARSGKPLILSTGMATLGDVEAALGVLAFGGTDSIGRPCRAAFPLAYASADGQRWLREHVTLLHCTTEYPAPFEEVNLNAITTLSAAFGLPVGFSDHTEGIVIPIAAAALGAAVVEKHFTLDRSLVGPDHKASLEPTQLAAMVTGIRQVASALGDGRKRPMPSETKNIAIACRSLVARRAIAEGERFSSDNLVVLRPSGGISPMDYFDWIGRTASRAYRAGERIGS
jgi:N-acetylneuraminate synthase